MLAFNQLEKKAKIDKVQIGDILFLESKGDWFDRIIKFWCRSRVTHTAMLVVINGSCFVVEARPSSQQPEYQMMSADWWVAQKMLIEKKIKSMNKRRNLYSQLTEIGIKQ